MRTAIIIRSLLFSFVLLAFSHASFGQIAISVSFGPPALPVYEQPICPDDGYIWTPGFWYYSDDDGYYWVPGTWVEAPQPGYLWTPGYWAYGSMGYYWVPACLSSMMATGESMSASMAELTTASAMAGAVMMAAAGTTGTSFTTPT